MTSINNLTSLTCEIPSNLPYRGRWIDNGFLSNMKMSSSVISYRDMKTHYVEKAYVAAKNPDAMVSAKIPNGLHFEGTFCDLIAQLNCFQAKKFGKPISRGGLVDPRSDWDDVSLAAMWSFQAMKFAPYTKERDWLLDENSTLVEWNNWGDSRWGMALDKKSNKASGRNALGRILIALRHDLLHGNTVEIPQENDWKSFQEDLFNRLEDKMVMDNFKKAVSLDAAEAEAQPYTQDLFT